MSEVTPAAEPIVEPTAAPLPKRPWTATAVALLLIFLAGVWLLPVTYTALLATSYQHIAYWAAFVLMLLPTYLLTNTGLGLLRMRPEARMQAIGCLVVVQGYILAAHFIMLQGYRNIIINASAAMSVPVQGLPSYAELLITLGIGAVCIGITAWLLTRPEVKIAYQPPQATSIDSENVV